MSVVKYTSLELALVVVMTGSFNLIPDVMQIPMGDRPVMCYTQSFHLIAGAMH